MRQKKPKEIGVFMGNFLPNLCRYNNQKVTSGILLKDFDEKGFKLKKGSRVIIRVISSDICFSTKYNRHLTVGVDVELL